MLHGGCLRRSDDQTSCKGMHVPSVFGRVGLNGVGQLGPSKVEEQEQKRREADASEKGQQGVKGTQGPVHVPVDETGNAPHGQLGDEEANDDQTDHGADRLPRGRRSPHRQSVRHRREWNLLQRMGVIDCIGSPGSGYPLSSPINRH